MSEGQLKSVGIKRESGGDATSEGGPYLTPRDGDERQAGMVMSPRTEWPDE